MFARIDLKLFAAIGTAVSLGLMILVLFYSEREEQNILAQNKRALLNVLDSTNQGLKTLMLSGYGDAGPIFAESLEKMQGLDDLRVIRLDGSQAFLDNLRISQVNQRVGFEQFYPRDEESYVEVLPPSNASLLKMLATQQPVESYDFTAEGERLYTLLYPVTYEDSCGECHARDLPLLGAIKLTSSLKQVDEDIAASRNLALVVLSLSLVLICRTRPNCSGSLPASTE
jgi:hypothetical protein